MGNRAVIIPKSGLNEDRTIKPDTIGVYVHWNGDRESIESFLGYCEAKEYRSPKNDLSYGFARLTAIIANFFDDGLSVGVDVASRLDCDNWDNGVYVIDGWDIVDRLYVDDDEDSGHCSETMMNEIDDRQPMGVRLGKEKIHAYMKSRELPWF